MSIPLRYARHEPFLLPGEQAKLANAHILLAGCGAGSTLAARLARLGVGVHGKLILADPDTVDISNLNRQEFIEADIGENKAVALKKRVAAINSDVIATAVPEGVTFTNIEALVNDSHIIIDMIDTARPDLTIELHRAACRSQIPVITGFDIGDGAVAYVFDHRNPDSMSLPRFIGAPDHLPSSAFQDVSGLPLALQFLLGPVAAPFADDGAMRTYYASLIDRVGDAITEALPDEAKTVLRRMTSGELDFVPQTDTAAILLGTLMVTAVRRILMKQPIRTAPDAIRLHLANVMC